jgi:NADPH-dependent curcumin reductase CurA
VRPECTDRFVIQLAKQEGLKVIASVGSDEKDISAQRLDLHVDRSMQVKFMREIGADVAFNYKTTLERAA